MTSVGVHIIALWTKTKNILNRTLAIDSPFQTLAVGLLGELIALLLLSPETLSSLSKLMIFLINECAPCSICLDDTIRVAQFHR